MTGIPATADELVITFDKVVTGAFVVTNPASDAPYISAGTGTSTVSITLTPGADYHGAVVNIPVPQRDNISVTSVVTKVGGNLLATSITPTILSEWDAVRKHGKKATAAFTPSMYSMVLAPGNLYTSGGKLYIAEHYYEHFYTFYSATDYNYTNSETYNANNRTHFSFNEIHYLMSSTGTTAMPLNSDVSISGSTDIPAKSDFGDDKTWRLPSADEWDSITANSRPGTTLTYYGVSGCRQVRTFVTGMDGKGITNEDYKTVFTGDTPSTNYQYGMLLFPDNIVLDGEYFTRLGTVNTIGNNLTYNSTEITKANLDLLIATGCAFLPAAGIMDTAGQHRYTGTDVWYWSSISYSGTHGKDMRYTAGTGNSHSRTSGKADNLRSVRLLRDIE